MADKKNEDENALKCVEVSPLTILRIVKDCHENLPETVQGYLLGLDEGSKLYVTDCFGLPQKAVDEIADDAEYQTDMLQTLRRSNIDCQTVGWYQSTYMGSFLSETLVDLQFEHQLQSGKSVVIVYDPLQLAEGKAFRAFRLQAEFMKKYAENKKATTSGAPLAAMSSHEILEEIEMKIVNPVHVEAFLLDQQRKQQHKEAEFASLDLENQQYLEKNIQHLLDSLDYLSAEQHKLQYYERLAVRQAQQQKTFQEKRKQENAGRKERGEELLPEEPAAAKRVAMPSQIDTLLLSNQIQTYCSQIQNFAGDSFGKVYLVGGVQ
jgi:translation initiation factor 3 subunit H